MGERHVARSENGEAAVRTGDRYTAVYTEHVKTIFAFIYSRVGTREVAEDITAEVFLKAFPAIDYTQHPASIRSWLYRVARTCVADYWRSALKTRVIPLDEAREVLRDSGPAPEAPELKRRAHEILEGLPDRYRQVLQLRIMQTQSVAATAEAMGLTENHVKVLQHRALKKARELVEC
jgi:RNA polymerase sigma-70 factor, ECF subfamily